MMNQETKIQLLPFEIDLVSKPDLILTKNAVLQKIKQFLEEVQFYQQSFTKKNEDQFPNGVLKVLPKISKGENYKGLPWLVLDYPRHFENKNVFAIRTMFWWGNFFSITLHISGTHKLNVQEKILSNIEMVSQQGFFLCVGISEWEHHFEENNYKKMKKIQQGEIKKIIEEKAFLKITIPIPIDSLSNVEKFLNKNYEILVRMCF